MVPVWTMSGGAAMTPDGPLRHAFTAARELYAAACKSDRDASELDAVARAVDVALHALAGRPTSRATVARWLELDAPQTEPERLARLTGIIGALARRALVVKGHRTSFDARAELFDRVGAYDPDAARAIVRRVDPQWIRKRLEQLTLGGSTKGKLRPSGIAAEIIVLSGIYGFARESPANVDRWKAEVQKLRERIDQALRRTQPTFSVK